MNINLKTGILFGIFLICIGCSSSENTTNDQLIFYPFPPDKPKIQFIRPFSSSTDFSGGRSDFTKFIMGEEEPFPIMKPYGISLRNGKLYICDTMIGALEIADFTDMSFVYFVPEGRGRLKKPINCYVDSLGYLYVADADRGQVVIFDNELDYFAEIGDRKESKPTDVFVSNDKIFVNDVAKGSVLIYDRNSLELIKAIPDIGNDQQRLYSPTNIFVHNNNLYVSDLGDSRIKVYDLEGTLLKSIGSIGDTPGSFTRPKGIAVDSSGNLYVVDAGFENIQIFDDESRLLLFFGGNSGKPGGMWLPAKVIIDYDHLEYFRDYVDQRYNLQYLIIVTNQYGPDKINIYGFINEK